MNRKALFSISGPDRPGVSKAFFENLSGDLVVLDIEQFVAAGLLQLGVLVEGSINPSEFERIKAAIPDMHVALTEICENQPEVSPLKRYRITLLGNPLSAAHVSILTNSIRTFNGNIWRIQRIATQPVTALQLEISCEKIADLKLELSKLAMSKQLDVVVQDLDLQHHGKQLVIMDVDSTVIQDEVVELLAARAGVADEVKRITDAAMAGELDFEQSLRARVKLLAGLSESIYDEVFAQVRFTPGAAELVQTLLRLGHEVALVSGGFTPVVAKIAATLGITHFKANDLEARNGILTGEVAGAVVDRATKAATLKELAAKFDLPLSQTIAVGDGANDLDMLAVAGLGIAFNAKPIVQQSADAAINLPYLNSVLYLMGITESEINSAH